jgi:hypothetical protein
MMRLPRPPGPNHPIDTTYVFWALVVAFIYAGLIGVAIFFQGCEGL